MKLTREEYMLIRNLLLKEFIESQRRTDKINDLFGKFVNQSWKDLNKKK